MRKMSEIQNEDALDVLVDIIDPLTEICLDKEVKKLTESKNNMGAIKVAIKNHKQAVMQILATLDGVPVEEYKVNLIQIPTKLFELLNDADMMAFFHSQGLKISGVSSGSVTENTTAIEK